MVWSWQKWLSPRPSKRTNRASEMSFLGQGGAVLYEFLREEDGRWLVKETHYAASKDVQAGTTGPPLHIHIKQDEHFKVEKGVLGAFLNGKEVRHTKDDGVLDIPRGTRHRYFPPPSPTEDLVFLCWADPQNLPHSFDENFLRNYAGYVADCAREGVAASPLQVLLIAYHSGTLISPDFWVPAWLLDWVLWFLAYGVAGFVLGYEARYAEYDAKKSA